MKKILKGRTSEILAAIVLLALVFSLVAIISFPAGSGVHFWEFVTTAVVSFIALIVALVILHNQHHNRIGWLLLVFAMVVSFSLLAQASYILEGGEPNMPSEPVLAMLIVS